MGCELRRFSYAAVVSATTPATNWSKFAVHPIADRLLWLLVNFLPVHPNILTLLAFALGLAAASFYVAGTATSMMVGTALFYVSFALDTIDGAAARLLDKRSVLGAWLDTMTDFLRSLIVAPAFAIGVFHQTADHRALYLGFAVLGVGLWYYYQAEVSQKLSGRRPAAMAQSTEIAKHGVIRKLGLVPSPFGLADYEAVYLVIFPLIGRPLEGMVVALIAGVLSRVAAAMVVLAHLRQAASKVTNG